MPTSLQWLIGGIAIYVIVAGLHTVAVSQFEFQPASRRFNEALLRHDSSGMDKALQDERDAIEREGFFWWLSPERRARAADPTERTHYGDERKVSLGIG